MSEKIDLYTMQLVGLQEIEISGSEILEKVCQEIRRGEREAEESDLENMRFVSRQSNSILAVD